MDLRLFFPAARTEDRMPRLALTPLLRAKVFRLFNFLASVSDIKASSCIPAVPKMRMGANGISAMNPIPDGPPGPPDAKFLNSSNFNGGVGKVIPVVFSTLHSLSHHFFLRC